jgi:TRAP-type transport system periplasmic protein
MRAPVCLRRRQCLLVVGAAASLALPALSRSAQLLRFGHTDTPNGTRQAAGDFFAQRLRALSGGEMQVAVFHSGQWGTDPQAVERLVAGTLDFTVSATGSYAALNKALDLAMLPYLVRSYEQGWALYDRSEWFRRQFAKLPAQGLRVLSTFEAGFRSFTTREAIPTLESLRGKKMRTFRNAMMEATLAALGLEPQVMPVTEVYLAIQKGQVFGQENPVDTIYSQRFHEVAPHVTLTQHVYSPIPLTVSEQRWAAWSEAQRKWVERAARDASRFSRESVLQDEQRLLARMTEQGAKIHRPDLEPWQRAVSSVYEGARKSHGADADALIEQARSIREGRLPP